MSTPIPASSSIPSVNPLGSPLLSSFGGKVPNPTSQIKQFFTSDTGSNTWFYKNINNNTNNKILTPTIQSNALNVYIPGDLTVNGTIINPSDVILKENIKDISEEEHNKILEIKPKTYNFKDDIHKKEHFGIIAQDLQDVLPQLVSEVQNKQHVNYLELIPLMISKMQKMQEEIDELKKTLKP